MSTRFSPSRLSTLTQFTALLACALASSACGSTPNVGNGDGDADVERGSGGESSKPKDDIDLGNGDGDAPSPGDGDGDGTLSDCGDGILEDSELCDDGNTDDGDGCSGQCDEVDSAFLCIEAGQPCMRIATCGNGIVEGDEVCDDGNTDDDGCSSACDSVADGYSCAKPGESCTPLPTCGNGIRERGEQCDDGEAIPSDGDGCNAICQKEDATGTVWECPPKGACVAVQCGDGKRTRNEQCDDGGTVGGDGCSGFCTVEDGFRCSSTGCRAVCGDGRVRGDEQCDDGDANQLIVPVSGDGCSASCQVESNFECDDSEPSVCQSTIVCGNGRVDAGEVCDPTVAGQGDCYGPSSSTPCAGYTYNLPEPVCGNGVLEAGELCDGGSACNGTCSAIVPGWECPSAGYCVETPVCGDGALQRGEQCDPGPISIMGCGETTCQITPDYLCSGEPSVCVRPVCGDGVRQGAEQCDDGDDEELDGCFDCIIEVGWVCPPGGSCQPICGDGVRRGTEQCDDGPGNLGNPQTPSSGDGCSAVCQIEPTYKCSQTGPGGRDVCEKTTCPSIVGTATVPERGEGCDDGNTIAGDGCGPTCQLEPTVTVGTTPIVQESCGDGLTTGSEQCDDGNRLDFDGCTSACRIEEGWYCDQITEYPQEIEMRVKYRDFKQRTSPGGHPHMKVDQSSGNQGVDGPQGKQFDADLGITGDVCTTTNVSSCGKLDDDGKPAFVGFGGGLDQFSIGGTSSLTEQYHKDAFELWFRDTPGSVKALDGSDIEICVDPGLGSNCDGTPIEDTLPLQRAEANDASCEGQSPDAACSVYEFEAGGNVFYPLGNRETPVTPERGFGYTQNPDNNGDGDYNGWRKNWHFTSELRYFFQYNGGETLTFFGDDDVWVFVNGRLAVDIGGIHGQLYGRVVLGDDGEVEGSTSGSDSGCSVHGQASLPALNDCFSTGERDDNSDNRFGLTKGGVYEIVIFQAERHPSGSNYRLTLDGFLAPRSACYTDCGDELQGGPELCDSGDGARSTAPPVNNNSTYGECRTDCSYRFCGDGIDEAPEACDNGFNIDSYVSGNTSSLAAILTAGHCAPGCTIPSYCGDGVVQWAEGETCDDGDNDGSYGGCEADCTRAAYCGDGNEDAGEDCDTPGMFTNYNQSGTNANPGCDYNCRFAGYCGDGTRNGDENCDPEDTTDPRHAFCGTSCDFESECGDGLKNNDEQCDYGVNNSGATSTQAPYNGCSEACTNGPGCGDGVWAPEQGEECDLSAASNTGSYDGCTAACLLGPHCGDAVTQAGAGETCDNGFNDDEYAYPELATPCGAGCSSVPFCGDGIVQADFESCDEGSANSSEAYDGCTDTCDYGPYCGDGKLHPSEICDNGLENKAYSADGSACGYDCTHDIPYCGDGTRNGPEECDDGDGANDGEYGGCNKDCTRAPRCGDGIVQREAGESCDDGLSGSLKCTPVCSLRNVVK